MVINTNLFLDLEKLRSTVDYLGTETVSKNYMQYSQLLDAYKQLADVPVTELAVLCRHNTVAIMESMKHYETKFRENSVLSSPILAQFKEESNRIYSEFLIRDEAGAVIRDEAGTPKIKDPENYKLQIDTLKKRLSTEEVSIDSLLASSNEEFTKIATESTPCTLATVDCAYLVSTRQDITAELLAFLTQLETMIMV